MRLKCSLWHNSGKSISEMKLLNENIILSSKILEQKLFEIAETMNDIIDRGIRKEGDSTWWFECKETRKKYL